MRQLPVPSSSHTDRRAAASRSGTAPGDLFLPAPNPLSVPELIPGLQRAVGNRRVQQVLKRTATGLPARAPITPASQLWIARSNGGPPADPDEQRLRALRQELEELHEHDR